VIKGWDLGVATMTRGERALFFIRHLFFICMTSSHADIVVDLLRNFEKFGTFTRESHKDPIKF
jgi:hypothetical protein